jgi:hypothetical protein
LLRRIAFGVGEGDVKCDHASTPGAQLIHQPRVVVSGKWEGSDCLECFFVNAYDHDAIVVRTLAAHLEPQIERALLDALKEGQAGMGVALQPGESKKRQARQRDCDGEPEVNMTKREFSGPLSPAWLLLRLQVNSAAVRTAGLAGAITATAASPVIQAQPQSHREPRTDQHIAQQVSMVRRSFGYHSRRCQTCLQHI